MHHAASGIWAVGFGQWALASGGAQLPKEADVATRRHDD